MERLSKEDADYLRQRAEAAGRESMAIGGNFVSGNMVLVVALVPAVVADGFQGFLYFLILAGIVSLGWWVCWCVQARRDIRRLDAVQQAIHLRLRLKPPAGR